MVVSSPILEFGLCYQNWARPSIMQNYGDKHSQLAQTTFIKLIQSFELRELFIQQTV